MKISIFGLGYVGCVSLGCLAKKGHNVIGVDVSSIKVDQINNGMPTIIENEIAEIIAEASSKNLIRATLNVSEAILNSDISIVAVGTPSSRTGHLDFTYIFKVAEQIGKALDGKDSFHTIAIRSTVMPGTALKFAELIEKNSTKKNNVDFAIVSNPEFLREGTAVKDYFNPPLTLIGVENETAKKAILDLYSDLNAELIVTDIKVAEIMKYINNTFHALKISFANEIGNICSAMDIDSHKVMNIFCQDKQLNISPYYFKPGFAYGGSCLPKDLKGLQTLAHDYYIDVPVINAIDKTNELQIQRAIEKIKHTGAKSLAFLGLSFKAGTDDLRNSPAVTIIETMMGKGFEIKIYDNNVQLSHLTGTNKDYIDKHIPHLSGLMVSSIEQIAVNTDLIILNNREPAYINFLKEQHFNKMGLLDMVCVNELKSLVNKFDYYGINW